MSLAENGPEARAGLAALSRGLDDLGSSEDRNLRIEYRGIEDRPEKFDTCNASCYSLAQSMIETFRHKG
jgi:hypothetical protein